ncbi:hypothetical protein LAh9_8 [Aeromonas phage LAh_9]|uniref:Uncharacterized protein n=3 Tax=Lahexavirus TaxID=2843411 RepID=A0A514A189_9CAUD|nr:hypothetical protein HWC30_gp005 [Aeromonas phage LAh_6]YP_009847402.1 hypothetical protein HWC31_gp064 [Aeromonas phage LAh_8]YP_009847489.1 hypothetical protein HWC32_gp008 [Aeromonas phage LAh_9]QDH46641.1 hypothetical protein LAh6_5 [Aeromonas phage LAh_6]QDH46859.1 hypothetical protein LAh8_64 [Aeromonas phage LAh_8]QDH47006.1 hypothetical protein LAh9_8 [Aeromonas phage LAh_9]
MRSFRCSLFIFNEATRCYNV